MTSRSHDASGTTGPRLDRRQMMSGIGASLLAGALPATGTAALASEDATAIAAKARALSDMQDRPLRLLLPKGSMANVTPVVEAFKRMSGIPVETEEVDVDQINSKLILDSLSGQGSYDLALPATFGIPDLAEAGTIKRLTDLAAVHEPEGFRAKSLYAIGDTFDGETYGFQTDGDAYLMFYNAPWLESDEENRRYADRHGIALDVPRTWFELDRQMAFFHRPDQDRFGGALFRTPGYLAWEWWVRFHAKGVWPMSPDLVPQIASDEGVAALEDMIRASEVLYPYAQTAGLFENWQHFSKGNTYCNIGWGGTQKYLNRAGSPMRGKLRFGPTPCGDERGESTGMPYFNWGWTYVVTQTSRVPELAYLFALFASTSEMSTAAVREVDGYFDPFRTEHYEDPLIVQTYSREFLDVHKSSLENAIPDLYLANQGEYFTALSEALDLVLQGQRSPKVALERAADRWSLINARSGHHRQTMRWRSLRDKYPAAIRSQLRDL